MADMTKQITEITAEQSNFLLSDEELKSEFFGRYIVRVQTGQICLLYRDGILKKQLGPGRYTGWKGFRHE
jgi:hypothetical protein